MVRSGRLSTLVVVAGVLLGQVVLAPTATAGQPDDAEFAPVMLVLDASGSMREADPSGGTRMDAAKRAVTTLVNQLPDGARLGLQVYGTGTGSSDAEKAAGCQDIKTVQPVGEVDKQALTAQVQAINPRGYTPIGGALRAAADALPTDTETAVVLVSDGEDTCAPPPPCDVAAELAAQGVDVQVHTVGFQVDETARQQLRCIAETTGGTYTDAGDAGELEERLPQVSERALRRYEAAGIPITGGADRSTAVEIGPGQYVDEYPPETEKFYRLDVPKDYTAHIAATEVVNSDESDFVPQVELTVTDGSGKSCFSVLEGASGTIWEGPQTAAISWDSAKPQDCSLDGPRYVSLRRLRGDVAHTMELAVTLEPPVTGDEGPPADDTAVEFAEPRADQAPVVGGGSFNDAAELPGSGSYTDRIQHGEYLVYKVDVGWGQGLACQVRFGDSDSSVAWAATHVYGPTRMPMLDYSESNDSYAGEAMTFGPYATPRVLYRNRPDSNGHDYSASLAGWHYIGVKLDPGSDNDVPITIDVTVAGDEISAPGYAGDVRTEPSRSSSADPSRARTTAAGQTTTAGPPWLLVAAVGVGVVVLSLLVLVIRRRTRQ
jgi:Ca-activated chloride channel homolog